MSHSILLEFMYMDSEQIKALALQLEADVCGIADVERFSDAPPGFHPCDTLKETRSVIVFGKALSPTLYEAQSLSPYTLMRNWVLPFLDNIAIRMAGKIENTGAKALPIPGSEPYEYWDTEQRQGKGILSLKHAAQLAGLGSMGKNTLLIHPQLGNRLWLGAILTNLQLRPDPIVEGLCKESCSLCLKACPQGALDGTTLIQKKCREICFKASEGGGWFYSCCRCLQACPMHTGH